MQEVNDRLETATNERSEYRQYLLEAQQELQHTREELLEWSEGLQVCSSPLCACILSRYGEDSLVSGPAIRRQHSVAFACYWAD